MKAPKVAPASEAQARFLASIWGGFHQTVPIGDGYVDPTVKRCVLNGWIVPTYKKGKFPSGKPYVEHILSEAGLRALARYLAKRYAP